MLRSSLTDTLWETAFSPHGRMVFALAWIPARAAVARATASCGFLLCDTPLAADMYSTNHVSKSFGRQTLAQGASWGPLASILLLSASGTKPAGHRRRHQYLGNRHVRPLSLHDWRDQHAVDLYLGNRPAQPD